MVEDRRTCNPQIYLLDVEWGNFTVSCVVKNCQLPFVPFSSFGFSTYMSSDIRVFLCSTIMRS